MSGEAHFFPDADAFRAWLEANHGIADEVLVGYNKRHTKKPSPTWAQTVDEALCFGWIDGVRRRVDEDRYTIRFTPRRPHSIWSATNVKRFGELEAEGRATEAGKRAFENRREDRTAIYTYELSEAAELPPEALERLKADKAAYEFFSSQAPWYRRNASHWVIRAKRPETRERRLAQLIADSRAGLRVAHLRRS